MHKTPMRICGLVERWPMPVQDVVFIPPKLMEDIDKPSQHYTSEASCRPKILLSKALGN